MKNISTYILLYLSCILLGICSCNIPKASSISTEPTQSEWRKISNELYSNSNGDIAFRYEPKGEEPVTYITTFGVNDTAQLRYVVDTSSFEPLKITDMFGDKHHVYAHYSMSSGGYLNVFCDEPQGIIPLGQCYFRYKNKVYHYRNGQLGTADPNSFVVSEKFSQIAKDKNGYFEFGDRVSDKGLQVKLENEAFNDLKK